MKPQTYLQQIEGVGIYPIITLLIFFSLFAFVAWSLLKPRPEHFQALSALPFDEDPNDEKFHS